MTDALPGETNLVEANGARDYRGTVFLPRTDFPMRGDLPRREPGWLARWESMGLWQRLRTEA